MYSMRHGAQSIFMLSPQLGENTGIKKVSHKLFNSPWIFTSGGIV